MRGEIRASAQRGLLDFSPTAPRHQTLLISRTLGRLPQERAEEFYVRLEALMKEFDVIAQDPTSNDPHIFGLAVVLSPITAPHVKEESGAG